MKNNVFLGEHSKKKAMRLLMITNKI